MDKKCYSVFLLCSSIFLPIHSAQLGDVDDEKERDFHPIAIMLNNIASVYAKQGKKEKALRYYQRALAIEEKKLGSDHPSVATTLNNIGLVYKKRGNYEEVLAYYRRSLAIKGKHMITNNL